MGKKYFVKTKEVDTQSFGWGTLEWLSEPLTTGADNMVTGVVTLFPGDGHERHNHEGCDENLYVLKGSGRQMLELADGVVEKEVTAGELIHIPAGIYHSTMNTGKENMEILAMYQYTGPEVDMRNLPDCKIISSKEK